MTKNFIISTPLYYANRSPHIGSAYTTIAADVLARFHHLQGEQPYLVTGVDEHGQKIERAAAQARVSPEHHCNTISASFQDLWDRLDIRYNSFVRTSSSRHATIVKDIFKRLWDNGDICLGKQRGWYCVGCEEFKTEKDLLDNNHCPLHPNTQVEWRDEENYFFRLSKYQDALETIYSENPELIQPLSRREEVLNFIRGGLKDFSISRLNTPWGIPVPQNEDHTFYVWFDALLGYISGVFSNEKVKPVFDCHLVGKDILRFHAVYWLAILLAADLPLPKRIVAHGFLTKDGYKISKTLGNTIDPFDLTERYGSDAVRYYFLKEVPFDRDGNYNESHFVDTVNADLANGLGNLLNRSVSLAHRYCGGRVPAGDRQNRLYHDLAVQAQDAYRSFTINESCEACLQIIKQANKCINDEAPWSKYQEGDTEAANTSVYKALESVRLAAYLLSPVTPNLSLDIYKQLGFEFPRILHGDDIWGVLQPGQKLSPPVPVYQKKIKP